MQPGDEAPQFTLPDETGVPVSLSDFAGGGLVIYFYPRAFTPGCTLQACDLRDRHDLFTAAGYSVVGISPDPVSRLARFRDKHDLPFPVLSDQSHTAAKAYGAWGTKRSFGKEYEGIIRSTFVIGPDGRILEAWKNVRSGGHADRLLAAIGDAVG